MKDIFEQAAAETLSDVEKTKSGVIGMPKLKVVEKEKSDVITQDNLEVGLNNITVEQKGNWDDLAVAMKTRHAGTFNQILENLPPREFVRVYLKALEYFMPKIIRQEGEGSREERSQINIQINRGKLPTK